MLDVSSDAGKPGYERIEGVQVGQYVSYRFFKVDPAWRRLPALAEPILPGHPDRHVARCPTRNPARRAARAPRHVLR